MRHLAIALVSLAVVPSGGVVRAQASADTTVTVLVPIDIERGAAPARAIAAMKEIASFIHRQPGLVSEQMMVADYESSPRYLHVMRWRSLHNWTDLSASRTFQALLSKDLPFVRVRLAQPYRRLP